MRVALSVFLVCAFLTQTIVCGEEGEMADFGSILNPNCQAFQGTWNWRANGLGVGRLVFQACRVYLFPVSKCNLDRRANITAASDQLNFIEERGAGGATACSSCYYASGGSKDDSPVEGPSFELLVGSNNEFDTDNDWECTSFGDDEFRCGLTAGISGAYPTVVVTRRSEDVDEDLALGIRQLNRMSPQYNYWANCMSP